MTNITIKSSDEREIAMNLIEKLSGAPEDTPEETRLQMLIEAVERWDATQDQTAATG